MRRKSSDGAAYQFTKSWWKIWWGITFIRSVAQTTHSHIEKSENVTLKLGMPRPPVHNWGSSPYHLIDDVLRAIEELGEIENHVEHGEWSLANKPGLCSAECRTNAYVSLNV